ncbi:Btz domain-containing protein [Heracleum sosnowskyi]|uniref:Btz domain-containing protein n=1 Tax=Heracleum sosnowskyi TaxID=360622 RepID=A0AAD8H488_9APIA|nr:Btz domain-containing protein [Heracleum sosnowskyi]
MASVAEDELLDYESDPEDAKLSLTMRRREASDDEYDDDQQQQEPLRRRVDSRGSDSVSEGADDEEVEEVVVESDVKVGGGQVDVEGEELEVVSGANEAVEGEYVEDGEGGDKEKKENEPFAVPTAGAFYMHDDRFRESGGAGAGAGGGRHRRNLGARNLWESKDDRKWGHDKFEEMTTQETHNGEGRKASRVRNRGRGKFQGQEHSYPRGNRPKTFNNDNLNNTPNNQKNAPKNLNNASKGVRGRGPRRYQSNWNEVPSQNKQHGKLGESGSYVTYAKVSERTSTTESDPIPPQKHVFSSLNSASPPFYPSASSNKEISSKQKRDDQAVQLHRNQQTSGMDESFSISESNTMRGKNVADYIGMNKLYIDDQVPTRSVKPLTSQSPHSRIQGKVQTPIGKMNHQSTPQNQVYKVSNQAQQRNGQQSPSQTRQASLQTSGRELGQRTQPFSSPDSSLTANSFDLRETGSPPETSKSNPALIGKGKNVQGNGRGSFPYGAAQVIGASGNSGSTHGDVNFPGMPTFLPVMQFGGQHPGGIGVPAVGMAFPGYVGNPGSGNSEMTWLPVLAGPAGALGASYSSPYLSVDGGYHARPSGQVPSLAGATSKDNNVNKPANEMMPSRKQELAGDEFGQRQNKARRYTEMKFDQ